MAFVNLKDAASIIESAPSPTTTTHKVGHPLSLSQRGKVGNAVRRLDTERVILVRDSVHGERAVDFDQVPAHIRRYYGSTTLARRSRVRPHRNDGSLKGGPRALDNAPAMGKHARSTY